MQARVAASFPAQWQIAPTKESKLPRRTRREQRGRNIGGSEEEDVTHKVLRADVGAVEGEGRDRLDVPGRRGQVEGGAAVLGKRGSKIESGN